MEKQRKSTLPDAAAGGDLSVAALKRAGQQRDLERQRQGVLRGTDVARGMAAIAKRAKLLAY